MRPKPVPPISPKPGSPIWPKTVSPNKPKTVSPNMPKTGFPNMPKTGFPNTTKNGFPSRPKTGSQFFKNPDCVTSKIPIVILQKSRFWFSKNPPGRSKNLVFTGVFGLSLGFVILQKSRLWFFKNPDCVTSKIRIVLLQKSRL